MLKEKDSPYLKIISPKTNTLNYENKLLISITSKRGIIVNFNYVSINEWRFARYIQE